MIKRPSTWILIAGMICAFVIAHAQQPNKKPDAISEAIKAEADASAAFDTAKANLDAARANTRAVLYQAMAEQGVKPSECTDGTNPFACVVRDPKTGAWTFTPKKAAKKE